MEGFSTLPHEKGIIPALESSQAIVQVMKMAPTLSRDTTIVVCLSGRGDKDMHTVAEALGVAF